MDIITVADLTMRLYLMTLLLTVLSRTMEVSAFVPVLIPSHSARAIIRSSSTLLLARSAGATATTTTLGEPICEYHQVNVTTSESGPPRQAISVHDLTGGIQDLLKESGMHSGTVTVISRHTTTSVTINERESRLARDMAACLLQLVPPDERSSAAAAAAVTDDVDTAGIRYEHNDIDQRPESEEEADRCRQNGWDVTDAAVLRAWRDQEPINAHSHLLSMLLGSSESIPVVEGSMVIGQWQSVLLVDLDGPRQDRTVGVQLMGYR